MFFNVHFIKKEVVLKANSNLSSHFLHVHSQIIAVHNYSSWSWLRHTDATCNRCRFTSTVMTCKYVQITVRAHMRLRRRMFSIIPSNANISPSSIRRDSPETAGFFFPNFFTRSLISSPITQLSGYSSKPVEGFLSGMSSRASGATCDLFRLFQYWGVKGYWRHRSKGTHIVIFMQIAYVFVHLN